MASAKRAPFGMASRGVALFVGTLWLLATVPAVIGAGLSGLAADSGASLGVYVFIAACHALPLTTLIAAICSFVGAAKRQWRLMAYGSAVPFIAMLAAFLAPLIASASQ